MIKKNDFIVSCQALENEPLHSSFIMGRLSIAAKQGGAKGIRANSQSDILEIKKCVELPIIGIIKKDYSDSSVYITATVKEVDELVQCGVDVIALDATDRLRPNNINLGDFFKLIKEKYPNQKFMADCSTFSEMSYADQIGFDYIGTTLFGYTDYSKDSAFKDINEFNNQTKSIKSPIIAEGQIDTPSLARKIKDETNSFAVVVGGAITRPQSICENFTKTFYEK